MTQNNNPAIGNFTLKTPITYKAVQYTGDESLPAIRELLESIGYDPDVVGKLDHEITGKLDDDLIILPAVGVDFYTGEGEDDTMAQVGDFIVVRHVIGFPKTATITVLGKEHFEKLFDKEV